MQNRTIIRVIIVQSPSQASVYKEPRVIDEMPSGQAFYSCVWLLIYLK